MIQQKQPCVQKKVADESPTGHNQRTLGLDMPSPIGAFFLSQCYLAGTAPNSRKKMRLSVGHQRRPAPHPVQMTSPDPSLHQAGRGRLRDPRLA